MSNRPNATQALLGRTLGIPLHTFVLNRRKVGASWQRIADELNERCDTNISSETLRRWFSTGLGVKRVA